MAKRNESELQQGSRGPAFAAKDAARFLGMTIKELMCATELGPLRGRQTSAGIFYAGRDLVEFRLQVGRTNHSAHRARAA